MPFSFVHLYAKSKCAEIVILLLNARFPLRRCVKLNANAKTQFPGGPHIVDLSAHQKQISRSRKYTKLLLQSNHDLEINYT